MKQKQTAPYSTVASASARRAANRTSMALICCCIAGLTFCVTAQMDSSLGGYSSMEIEAGRMIGNFATGAIEEMTGGVRIRLLSDDPDMVALPIGANTMRFTWTPGQTTPTTIVMDGNVQVDHPDATIRAGHAEWDFDSGALVFSGNPEVDSDRLKGLRGEKMTLNIKDNTFEVTQVRADQVPLQAPDAQPHVPSGGLREQDIHHWGRLIESIKAEAVAEAPTPGKQILAQLPPENRQLLLQLDTNILIERKSDLLRMINNVLATPAFYHEAAWADKSLPDEAVSLLASESRDSQQQLQLNRLLLEAAYPFAFVDAE